MTVSAFNMQERKEPKFITFNDGDVIEGVLVKIDTPTVNGKKVPRFVLDDGDVENDQFVPSGDRSCFLGTWDIMQKLRTTDIGHYVSVRCEGVDKSIVRNGNALRRFKVFVSALPINGATRGDAVTDLGITDADIPF